MPHSITRPAFGVATKLLTYASELYETDPWELVRVSGQRRKFHARWAVIWTLRQLNPPSSKTGAPVPYSYKRLARLLGFDDHTSVRHGEIEAAKLRAVDPKFRELTDKMLAFAQTCGPQVPIDIAA